ncbi:hypothetical protein LCGC14_0686910 [marine sediment metagenome]|uniref:Uracil-DNA glycosylase-like domain-containing protein n=1 Tax=marine sediment metagenome TaxID=412755 RepID=A0A0F9T7V4_9ZZZZ
MRGTVVPFIGPSKAKIFIVGEAPGGQEEIEGKPFVGGSGRLLNRLLMEVGLVREECMIGNVMRMRPPGNNFAHFYADKQMRIPTQQLVEGVKYLKESIRECNPNIVLALGNEALYALMGHRGITNWRGSILFNKTVGCKVLPTLHPASLLRAWDNLPLVMFDFRRLKEESATPDYELPKREFILQPTYEKVMQVLDTVGNAGMVAFDVETDMVNHITAIAFATSPFHVISIPFTIHSGAPYWKFEEESEIWARIKYILEDEKVRKVAQNAQFDIIMHRVNPRRIHVKGLELDTMCAFHTLYPEMAASRSQLTEKTRIGGGKTLGLISGVYTKQPYYKHWAHTSDDKQFWKYNAMDAAVTYESAIAIKKEMKEFGVTKFYYKYVHPLIDILLEMQLRGVRIDQEVRVKASEDYARETEELQGKLDKAVGRPVNVMSPLQMKQLLYTDLNLPVKYKRGTTNVTADEEALKDLAKKYPSPVFDFILKIRHNRKIMGTYLVDKGGMDGRMRCSYVIGGTETGRLSSRKSVFGTGTNLQNIPTGVCRKMFVSDEDKVFIQADLSQAEARVVAYLSEEERLIDLFKQGGDVHTQNAAWVYGKECEEVTPDERALAKRLVHASHYGIGGRAFAYYANIQQREAQILLSKYFDTFPNIRAWQLRVQSELSRSRTMTTPLGRKRTFFGRWGEQLFREAYAFVPQSTVTDTLNLAMIKLYNTHPDVEFMLQVHDAFVLQCDKDEVEDWISDVKHVFDIPILINGRELVIPVDIKVGVNWDEMKKLGVE